VKRSGRWERQCQKQQPRLLCRKVTCALGMMYGHLVGQVVQAFFFDIRNTQWDWDKLWNRLSPVLLPNQGRCLWPCKSCFFQTSVTLLDSVSGCCPSLCSWVYSLLHLEFRCLSSTPLLTRISICTYMFFIISF
jgi:hypothetical protein